MLYLKVAELLSSGLQMAIEQIKAGKLCLSSTVKQGKSPPGTRPTGLPGMEGLKVLQRVWRGVNECEPHQCAHRLISCCPLALGGMFLSSH